MGLSEMENFCKDKDFRKRDFMKLIVFSDIHGNSYALNGFLEQIRGWEYDFLVFCGDIFGYYYNQKEILETLSSMDRLIWLRGNHDGYFLKLYGGREPEAPYIERYGHSYSKLAQRFSREEAKLVASRRASYEAEWNGQKVGIFHGTPRDHSEGRLYPDTPITDWEEYQKYGIVILGHTHCRMLRSVGKTLIVNPGSLGQPRDGKGYSFAVVDTDTKSVAFEAVQISCAPLYRQIEEFDPYLKKLKEVLERRA